MESLPFPSQLPLQLPIGVMRLQGNGGLELQQSCQSTQTKPRVHGQEEDPHSREREHAIVFDALSKNLLTPEH